MTTNLKFPDELAARTAFTRWMSDGEWPAYMDRTAVDVIGIIQRPTGEVLQTENGEIAVFAPVPGWHINLSEPVPELAQYEIEAPATPARVFAGSCETVAPRVPAERALASQAGADAYPGPEWREPLG